MTEFDPGEHSVSELEEELRAVGSVEALESLLVAEQEGRDRKTAKEAIEDRIEAVAEGATGGANAVENLRGAVEDLRATGASAAPGLVERSTALARLFGDDLAEPVAGTVGFAATFGLLVAAALWAVVTAAGGPLLWTVLVSLGALSGAALVVVVGVALADVDERWLAGGIVWAAYLFVGGGLLVVSLVLRGLLGGGFVLGVGGFLAPMAVVLGLQGAALMLVFEAYSRPVLPAAELDGAAPSAASLHVANWWRVAGVGLALEVVLAFGLPGWVGASRYSVAGAGLAWLFVPTAAAVGALVVYVLRKAAVVEQAVTGG